ncbi:MFS transporter [Thalassorhabdomicrobium marinisediminis]|uniref:Major facilitator superfamily (MFS) profile domain-containing protein n=1 Tax=Thalassorhabdomicrobium marinisediminis TaxID=2170577 RepID=A0A2T7FZD6_9RHOB|nr:MFS transporter [Thalassorhabdomicrobium marinisediminis]PVA07521.1 hypothetical protein DC363_02490 [Thalassorhabdomicrobium marinisediminis]
MLTALRDKNLCLYLAGNLLSITGTWAQRVAVFWIAWDLTASTTILGVLAALDLAPALIASPVAGVLADRRPLGSLIIIIQVFSALPPIILAGFTLADQVTVPLLLAVTAFTGLLSGFDHPLRLLLVGSVADRSKLSSAITLNSLAFNIGRMIGPAIGGLMISMGWFVLILSLNAASFFLFSLILGQLRIAGSHEASFSRASDQGLRGWASVFQSIPPIDRWLFTYFLFLGICVRPIFELLPSFASRFASNAVTETHVYSSLTSAQGFGAMLGVLMTSFLIRIAPRRQVSSTAGLAATLAVFAFLFGTVTIAIGALAVLSGAILTNGISTQIMLQTNLPREVQGRALAFYTMTLRGAPALGAVSFGVFAGAVAQEVLFSVAALVMFGSGLRLQTEVLRLG